MTPEKQGRSVHAVTFRWRWKDPHDAAETVSENERHSIARRRQQDVADAPPMIEDRDEAARLWWDGLGQGARDDWSEKIGQTFEIAGKSHPRPERILRRMAFDVAQPDALHATANGAPRNRVMKR